MMNLKQIKKELKNQDNCGTENPMFVILKRIKVSADPDYFETWEYVDDEFQRVGNTKKEIMKYLRCYYEDDVKICSKLNWEALQDWCERRFDTWTKYYFQEIEVFITAFFTLKSARKFKREYNKRCLGDEPKVFVYVKSWNRNPEMLFILEKLKGEKLK